MKIYWCDWIRLYLFDFYAMTAPIVNPLPYDKTSPGSILEYAQFLKWKTFWEVLDKDPNLKEEQKEKIRKVYDVPQKRKSRYWDFIQENFFYIDRNSKSEADLNEAWVELKVSPYTINKVWKNKWKLSAWERLSLTMIDYEHVWENSYEESHLLDKCALMLLVFYLRDENKVDKDYFINYVDLFQFPKEDIEIIKQDYNFIIEKIKAGKAHELSEWDTRYLWACTKWQNASKLKKQPFSSIKAKSRWFSLKQSYMSFILNKYIATWNKTYELSVIIDGKLDKLKTKIETYWRVIKDIGVLKNISFEDYIISKMEPYYWMDADDLLKKFWIDSTAKSNYYMLAKKMLWVDEDKIEEFEKANIQIKTIRLKSNWVPKEAMSFPTFKYMDIVKQDYYDSELYEKLSEDKFLFMVFEFTDKKEIKLRFKKAMFWHTPWEDLEWKIKTAWNETKSRIMLWEYNDLVKISDDLIIHVRPHARNANDTYQTPNWWQATKKCFWFNQKYIKEQIEKGGN